MIVQDPSKGNNNDVDAIFNQARQLGAVEGPIDQLNPSSSSRNFAGTGIKLSEDAVPPAPQQPEAVVNSIVFWSNGFTVNDGPLRRLDDPENASFLELIELQSIRKSECPKELEPADRRSSVHVNLIRRDGKCPEPEIRHVPFQGLGRTLGSSSSTQPAPEPTAALAPLNSASTPSTGLVMDKTLPSTQFSSGWLMVHA